MEIFLWFIFLIKFIFSRQQILNTMIEQRQNLEFFFMNDTIENENRILRQINDFIIVLSKSVCENIGKNTYMKNRLINDKFFHSFR